MIKKSISEMALQMRRGSQCVMPVWDLAAGADESPQLRMGGQLQGFPQSSGSPVSAPSSSPRVLSKGHHSLKKQAVLQLCKKHCFKRMFLPNLPYFFFLASSWYSAASSLMGIHGSWIIRCNNCCI